MRLDHARPAPDPGNPTAESSPFAYLTAHMTGSARHVWAERTDDEKSGARGGVAVDVPMGRPGPIRTAPQPVAPMELDHDRIVASRPNEGPPGPSRVRAA